MGRGGEKELGLCPWVCVSPSVKPGGESLNCHRQRVGGGVVSGDQGGDGVTVFQEGLGYVSVRVMRVQEAGLQLGYVWG